MDLKVQRRLAASVLKCGKGRVWMDPSEATEIGSSNTREHIRKLVSGGIIIKKLEIGHSRKEIRERRMAKIRGRMTGPGKRHGCVNARTPRKKAWIGKIRSMRQLIKKYKESGEIDRHTYHKMYRRTKSGSFYKSRKNLVEEVHRIKVEKERVGLLSDQAKSLRAQKEGVSNE